MENLLDVNEVNNGTKFTQTRSWSIIRLLLKLLFLQLFLTLLWFNLLT